MSPQGGQNRPIALASFAFCGEDSGQPIPASRSQLTDPRRIEARVAEPITEPVAERDSERIDQRNAKEFALQQIARE